MTKAKNGDTVKVHYTGKLNNGRVFDTSNNREPLEFKIGSGQIIPGFENAVIGMSKGDNNTANIPSDEAYGPHRKELVMEVGLEQLPPDFKPEIGGQLEAKQPNGQVIVVTITDIKEESVVLDANHPLAGQDLTFEIELIEIM